MPPNEFTKRRAKYFALLFFCTSLCSCTPPTGPSWSLDAHHSSSSFSSAKLSLDPQNIFNELGLEIMQTPHSRKVYLLVKSKDLHSQRPDQKIPLKVVTLEGKQTWYCTLLEGGQRALLAEKDAEQLMHYLEKGISLSMQVNHYRLQLPEENLTEKIKGLKQVQARFIGKLKKKEAKG